MHERIGKQTLVYNWLRDYIEENRFSVSNKLPSENALTRRMNVSRDTVRSAMNTLEKEGLIYRVQGSGSYINKEMAVFDMEKRPGMSRKIGVILQGQDPDANRELLAGIRSVFDENTTDLRIYFTNNRFSNERACLDEVMHNNFDGFIIDGVMASIVNPNLDCYHSILAKNIPIIFYNNYYKELKCSKVTNNDISGAEELVSRLADCGHKKIMGIFVSDNYQSAEKFCGYVKALQKYGCVFDDDYVKWCVSSSAYKKSFEKEIGKFIKSQPECTAIVCCNYMLLKMVQKVLLGMGKKVPGDYSLVCFDYSKEDWVECGITCSVHQGKIMGIEVSKRLLRMMENKDFLRRDYSCILEPYIHDGDSVGEVRK